MDNRILKGVWLKRVWTFHICYMCAASIWPGSKVVVINPADDSYAHTNCYLVWKYYGPRRSKVV